MGGGSLLSSYSKGFTLAGGATHVATLADNRFSAFTLAEVLITLGIIGVVAALTIPNLVANHQKKALEAAFKKSYSLLSQAIVYVEPELLGSVTGDNTDSGSNNSEFYTKLFAQYKLADNLNKNNNVYGTVNVYKQVKSYNNTTVSIPGCMQVPQLVAADGTSIGGMYNCFANWIVIDTTGPRKGPNAMGQDIFYFGINDRGRLIPLGENITYSFWNFSQSKYCSKTSTDAQNGVGCTKYAIANECPDDKTKTYWECLPR